MTLTLPAETAAPYVYVDNRALVISNGQHGVIFNRTQGRWLAEARPGSPGQGGGGVGGGGGSTNTTGPGGGAGQRSPGARGPRRRGHASPLRGRPGQYTALGNSVKHIPYSKTDSI